MLRNNILDKNVSVRCGGGDHICASLDLVGDYRIVAAVHVLDSADFNCIRTGSANVRAHGVEEVREVNYVRLFCGVFNNGQPLRLDCGEDNIDRRADRSLVKINGAAFEPLCGGVDYRIFAYRDC